MLLSRPYIGHKTNKRHSATAMLAVESMKWVRKKVLVVLPTDPNKLIAQWQGPLEIATVVNVVDYAVKIETRSRNRKVVFHINMIKL